MSITLNFYQLQKTHIRSRGLFFSKTNNDNKLEKITVAEAVITSIPVYTEQHSVFL